MIKLFSLKQQKKDGEATPKAGTQKKASAAQLRITKGEYYNYFTSQFKAINAFMFTRIITTQFFALVRLN